MTETKRPRRPSVGGYARGDETRQRIIEAAIKLFGEHGFDGASTRDIATEAGVNAPALQYYFENKEGVYQACAKHIINDLQARFAPAMQHASNVLKSGDTNAVIDAYLEIQAMTVDTVLIQSHVSKILLIRRELAGEAPNVASKLLQRKMKEPANKLMLEMLAHIMGTRPTDTITRIRLLALKGLVLAFYYPPNACLELLQWKEIDAAKVPLIKSAVLEHTRTLLESWRAPVAATAVQKGNKTARTKKTA
jgi:TetR/AcrR family transcriptional regulator, regulator of cefoperazone and chloramphenicol sensitivity